MKDKIATKPTYSPSKGKPYFVYDPLGDQFCFFASEQDRDTHAKGVIQDYFQDGWDQEVVNVISGELTSRAAMVALEYPTGELDENRIDEDGEYWPDYDYTCDYVLMPLDYVPPKIKIGE